MAQYNRKDHLYTKAKAEGFRSRASYKLEELQQRFSLMSSGDSVLDLGAWPGGWCQVALEKVGPAGRVVGIDLQELEPLDDARFLALHGDVRDEELLRRATSFAEGTFSLVMSDMSPKLTGIREADQGATVACAELALWAAGQVLSPGGNFVVKVFKGGDVESFVKAVRPVFNKVTRAELKSSRSTSNEFYVVGLGFRRES